jgi:hypothetical protein
MHGEIGNTYKIVVGESQLMKTFDRPAPRWEFSIKINFIEIGHGSVELGLIWSIGEVLLTRL